MKRKDIEKILVLGSGPIVIGQACEFDYSGTQACKALKREGYQTILLNSNPATIMTDPETASTTYIEPLNLLSLESLFKKEKPQAMIPTLGGQTALNLSLEAHDRGLLKKYGVELLGADEAIIRSTEDRERFCKILDRLGAQYPKGFLVHNLQEGQKAAKVLGYPLILRPNYTLGGGGGGIAYTFEEYQHRLMLALEESPSNEVLVEESILGWHEFELELMHDSKGSFVVVCSIENIDPCGVHTGDSITVAPQQTLNDREYQSMRDEAAKILREVGVRTGGANIQFAIHPQTRERVVIEMNPRVSRSSALASKATGFPIAKIAALLAVGYNLDELVNDITGNTSCCYEPALDYVVTKIPFFAFDKFASTKDELNTQMKSVGEVMAIGRSFQESLMKALFSLEKPQQSIGELPYELEKLSYPHSQRLPYLFQGFRAGDSPERIRELTSIHPWFLEQIQGIVQMEKELKEAVPSTPLTLLEPALLLKAKRMGFSDERIGTLRQSTEKKIRDLRHQHDLHPNFEQVDTCAGEFQASTPYFYSTYWGSNHGELAKSGSASAKLELVKSGSVKSGRRQNRGR